MSSDIQSTIKSKRGRAAAVLAVAAALVSLPLATASAVPADSATQTVSSSGGSSAGVKEGPTSVAYVEVNNDDLANVGRYSLEDGSPVFDVAIIFAANIDYDGSKAVLSLNERVQATLDDADDEIRPLQERGIKVSLSILGNHQGAGVANFESPAAAADFAAQVADVVERNGLDGVDLDDEYSDYGKNGTPQPNADSAGWLISALRTEMPDATLSFYDIGPASASLAEEDRAVNAQLDYAWNPFYGTFRVPNIPGLAPEQLSPAAVDIQATSADVAASLATRTVDEGFGVFLTYNLPGDDRSEYVSSFTGPLYGQSATFD